MANANLLSALTDQEKRVLECIGEGMTSRQIAERMFRQKGPPGMNYVPALLGRLGMQRRTQAAALADPQAPPPAVRAAPHQQKPGIQP
jgi:two-component system, NarL family, response regulator DevR